MMFKAEEITKTADILIVAGTSLSVYPAALLAGKAPSLAQKYIIDPCIPPSVKDFHAIALKASLGLPKLVSKLLDDLV